MYTPEVYPTKVRALGLGASSTFGRIGGIVVPYIAQVCVLCVCVCVVCVCARACVCVLYILLSFVCLYMHAYQPQPTARTVGEMQYSTTNKHFLV